MTRTRIPALALTTTLLLAACGPNVPTTPGGTTGGGTGAGSGAPTVNIMSASGSTLSSTTLTGPVAQFRLTLADQDGTITGVKWVVTQGGTTVAQGTLASADIKAVTSLNLPSLPAGTYTLTVTATDNSGKTGTATAQFIVDAQRPSLTSVKVDGTGVTNGATLDRLVNQSAILTVTSTDNTSSPTISVYNGTTLVARDQGTLTFDLKNNNAGPAIYTIVSTDAVGNSVSQTFTVNYAQTNTETAAPVPVLLINNTDAEPYSNVLSVTASAGVAPGVSVKQMILQITDAKGIVDTNTFTSTAENATFNIDTTKYPDGTLKLQLFVVDSTDKRGQSAVKTVQIANSVAPTITVVSPTNGANVSGPTQVKVQFRQNNTAFTFQPATMTLDIIDSRGAVVTTQTAPIVPTNQGLWEATTTVDFNATQYLNAGYTLRASANVKLANETITRNLTATSAVNNQSSVGEAPALNILLPSFFDPQATLRPVLTRKSAVAIQVSDSDAIRQVQLQFVCDALTKLPTQTCNTDAYNYNIPIGRAGLFYRVFNTGVLMDGQPFVENGNYVLRVTATDQAGHANIKEMNVVVDRSKAGIANLMSNHTYIEDNGGSKLTPTTANWYIGPDPVTGVPTYNTNVNVVRVLDLWYSSNDAGIADETPSLIGINPEVNAGSVFTTRNIAFGKEGTYRNSFLIQDLTTGVVEFYPGGQVIVTSRQ
ncbi:hypothetical protein LAJ19_07760 [Deinococcus taeanensis]|uniref:hypothetical protein n=1 Tax=Deinococcus taeanensis TaxID=2737050 RepID=UPI001CDB6E92|nr:hypothetical protein [Deinococcus taeanensis]UBV41562.1 hypothetical protein LAJ19_07760 [Deinococcus taeanensis]